MIIEKDSKVHISYRALFENSTRRHFLGQVLEAEGAVCRLEGFEFIYDKNSTMFVRRPEMHTTIIDVAESGYVVNIINPDINLDNITYKYMRDIGLIATDGQGFTLNINEFGAKS